MGEKPGIELTALFIVALFIKLELLPQNIFLILTRLFFFN